MDYASELLDEIALEGLDGITIDGLWIRLAERPSFVFTSQVKHDERVKTFLWSIVRRLRDVEFYQLAIPRKPITITDVYTVDDELGIMTESESVAEDIYPYECVDKDGVVGSCSTYNSREIISKEVRLLDLYKANLYYGNSLVIVASQIVRRNALINQNENPNLEISPIQFCILERIGRSRYHGESTQGKLGLAVVGEDAKTIFYLRKYLLKHNLIKKQCLQQKSGAAFTGLLLHLTRFYRLVKPRYIVLIETLIQIIQEDPNKFVDYEVLRQKVPGYTKKLTKTMYFKKYFRWDMRLPYRAVYPNATQREWKQRSTDKERIVRVISLLDPNVDVQEVHKRLLNINDDDDDEDEKGEQGILDDSNRYLDRSLMSQCSKAVRNEGADGLSQVEIGKLLGLPKVQARTTMKNFTRTGAAGMYMVDNGRQRFAKFYLKHCSELSESNRLLAEGASLDDMKNLLLSEIMNSSLDDLRGNVTTESQIEGTSHEINVDISTSSCLESCTDVESTPTRKRKIDSSISENKDNDGKKKKLDSDGNRLAESDTKITALNDNIDKSINNDIQKIDQCMNETVEKIVNETTMVTSNDGTEITIKLKNDFDLNSFGSMAEGLQMLKQVQSKCVDVEKMNVTVSISDDYSWLLPKTGEIKLERIKEKSLNTLRLLKRSNLIIEAVHELKIISDIKRLTILINKSECSEGLPCRMDKKSLMRILFKLASNNHIKIFRVTLSNGINSTHLNFICDISVKQDDPIIRSAIEFNKLKFRTQSVPKKPPNPSTLRRKQMTAAYEKRSTNFHIPKFNRMSVLHKFLFYLVHDYTGSDSLDQTVAQSKIEKQCERSGDELIWPELYLTTTDERMFVPPLPKYTGQGQNYGWCLLSDILIRIPLSIFVQLVQIPYFIPELDDYLNDPIKKYFLVSSLPVKVQNCMTATRKYIFIIFDILLKLAYIGLIQFGSHQNKEKDQIFIFINKNTVLMDTTASNPSYNTVSPDIDYPLYTYRFDSIQNVHDYWHNCWKICMNTKLGVRSQLMGMEIILENIQDKQEMMDAVRPRDFTDAVECDTGYVPGDKLGAAGFDSALYSHLKRNWICKISLQSSGFGNTKVLQNTKLHSRIFQAQRCSTVRSAKYLSSVIDKLDVNATGNQKDSSILSKHLNKPKVKRAINIRRINPVKKSLRRKPYYDQVDREALRRMSKLRVDWSAEEDRILLICKISSTFLCSDTRKQLNANIFLTYREVLHKLLQLSKNKTSRACQRRVTYMLRSATTRHNVHLCVEELKRDNYITEKYSHIFDHVTKEAKSTGKRISDMGNVWREHFKDLVSELMDRYNNSDNISFHNIVKSHAVDFLLPNTLQEFQERYSLQQVEKTAFKQKDIYQPVTNITDIYTSVINGTIHSTLSCNSDKTSWSYHLFSIYQQYPEKLLRGTLDWLRDNHMVSFRKAYQIKSSEQRKSLYLPLSSSPYQLSISYFNLMQTKYQSKLYVECYKTFNDLINSPNVDSNLENSDMKIVCKSVELPSLTGGSAAAIVELFSDGNVDFTISIPEQIIILDPDVKLKDETYSRLVQRYEDILTINRKDLTSSVLFQKHHYSLNEDSFNSDADDSVDGVKSKECTEKLIEHGETLTTSKHVMQNVAKASSRIALYMMDENRGNQKGLIPKEVDHVYDFFVVNSCKIFAKINCLNRLLEDPKNDRENPDLVADSQIQSILQDLCNSAFFHGVKIDKTCEPCVKKEDDDEEVDEYKIVEHDEATMDEIIHNNFNDVEISLVKTILIKMKARNEFGLTNNDLVIEFGNTSQIVSLVDKLLRLSIVVNTGVVHCRYIYYTFVRPWLLCSFRDLSQPEDASAVLNVEIHTKEDENDVEEVLPDNKNDDVQNDKCNSVSLEELSNGSNESVIMNPETIEDCEKWKQENKDKSKNQQQSEPIRVIMRPWIRVDGSLNRRVIDALLGSILSHIMLHPGISLSQIQDRFSPAFQPQNTREACDILGRLHCIVTYCITVKGKPSLFSKPSLVYIEQSTGLEANDSIRYETTKFAIINLGKFLDTSPYTQDLFECSLER